MNPLLCVVIASTAGDYSIKNWMTSQSVSELEAYLQCLMPFNTGLSAIIEEIKEKQRMIWLVPAGYKNVSHQVLWRLWLWRWWICHAITGASHTTFHPSICWFFHWFIHESSLHMTINEWYYVIDYSLLHQDLFISLFFLCANESNHWILILKIFKANITHSWSLPWVYPLLASRLKITRHNDFSATAWRINACVVLPLSGWWLKYWSTNLSFLLYWTCSIELDYIFCGIQTFYENQLKYDETVSEWKFLWNC